METSSIGRMLVLVVVVGEEIVLHTGLTSSVLTP